MSRTGAHRGIIALAAALVLGLGVVGTAWALNIVRYYGYNYLGARTPVDECNWDGTDYKALACSGWNYWDRTRVWKNSGDCILVGFSGWNPNPPPHVPVLYEPGHAYCLAWNGDVITVDRTTAGAPPYQRSTCAYDTRYHGGNSSYVKCEGIVW